MPAQSLHSHSESSVLTSCHQETTNLSRASTSATTMKKKRRRSSSKKVRLVGQVYLKHAWSMYYDENSSKQTDKSKLGSFNTIQGFWRYYNQIVDPANFPMFSNLGIFKDNPTLPDSVPKKACKWTVLTAKGDTGKVWMKIVLAMIGEQFSHGQDISGVVLSVCPVLDNIILYGNNHSNPSRIEELTAQLRKLVENDTNHVISYQKEISSTSSSTTNLASEHDSSLNNSRKYVSSNDLAAEERALKAKHKKSSSFSNSQFPDISTSYRRHRKTKSSDSKKSVIGTARKSVSFSNDAVGTSSKPTSTSLLDNQRMSIFAQMYNNGANPKPFQVKRTSPVHEELSSDVKSEEPETTIVKQKQSSLNLSRMISLFILVLLVLSGFLFTPK